MIPERITSWHRPRSQSSSDHLIDKNNPFIFHSLTSAYFGLDPLSVLFLKTEDSACRAPQSAPSRQPLGFTPSSDPGIHPLNQEIDLFSATCDFFVNPTNPRNPNCDLSDAFRNLFGSVRPSAASIR